MERNYAIDFIKFFAIAAVVVIHTFPSDHELGYFILDNFSRFAVPFFFAASGYLFGLKVINNPKSAKYFKKYIIKILKIYFSWLLFYILYDIFQIYIDKGNHSHELEKYIENLTPLNLLYYGEGTSGYQLWFVISLAWSIALLYLFYRLKKIRILLILSLCLNIVGLFGQGYSQFLEIPIDSTRDALFIGLFYTTIGFWFASASPFQQSKKVEIKTYLFFFFLFFALQLSEGYWLEKVLSAKHGEYFFSTILLTVFLFLFTIKNQQVGKGMLITKIGGNALGIYTIHVLFIDIDDFIFHKFGIENMTHDLTLNLIDAFLVFSMSYITYNFIQYTKTRQLYGK
ncbi:acyltransferase [Neobacillus cucumis]|uniref:acyltransferase family protein n=1 Tax=Neobacillus cucumis TaxID=1740721 RepID=UPI0018E064D2|nr:acyltransferase [Neobacillus cucumis]MBI0579602.1 acyltransferase [Neobacillus cucumis]